MSGDTPFVCPLCGYRFREGMEACGACPMARACDAVCCPHCGYRLAGRSRILDALGRLVARLRRPWRHRHRAVEDPVPEARWRAREERT